MADTYIHRVHPNKSPLKISRKVVVGVVRKIYRAPIYRAHRVVIFAIAQLSCTSMDRLLSIALFDCEISVIRIAYLSRDWDLASA